MNQAGNSMAVFEKRVAKNGKVAWRAKVRLYGHNLSRTFERITDAKDWAKAQETDIKRGIALGNVHFRKHTLNELVEEYKAFKGHNIKPRQFDTRVRLLKWWQAELGDKYISDINVEALNACKRKLMATETQGDGPKRLLSPATVQSYLMAMSAVMTFARKELCWIQVNPMLDVPKPKIRNDRVRWLTEEERLSLLKACAAPERHPYLLPFVMLAISTGMRRGEIEGLRWGWIDFQRGIISVPDSKNGDSRAVFLTGLVRKKFLEMSKVRRIDSDLVFARKDGKKHVLLDKHWQEARKKAGIPDFRLHDLRHTAATYLLQSKASLVELSALLGHRSVQMVKRYAHLADSHAHNVVEEMNKKVFG